MDEAAKNSRDGATVNHNTAADTNMGEQKQDSLSTTTTTTTTTTTAIPEVTDIISRELKNANLSGDMLSLVNIIGKVIQSQFDTYLIKLDKLNNAKDEKISYLESKVSALEIKVTELQDTIDDVDQYERRDTVIISGPSLPDESTHENPSDQIVNTIKQHLHINMTPSDINVAHRLGPKQQGKKRPIIVKLQNRAKKSELVHACITVKPQLYINESLTPKRRSIYTVVRNIRAQHKHLFQLCYTSDGKIILGSLLIPSFLEAAVQGRAGGHQARAG
ncbi:hypothetical protein O3P69_018355 [Scylla paramamosain]|uniref:Uncharacterized protein n=1 Tax=Scylla paramamosain TaxID=85552 RepID=A0AAW0SCZ1_SCYPA